MNEEEERDFQAANEAADAGAALHHNICDSRSYCNILCAAFVMLLGLLVTIIGVFEITSDRLSSVVAGTNNEKGPLELLMILAGPVLINIGAIITVKTVVHLRKKILIRNAARRRALIRVSFIVVLIRMRKGRCS